MSQAADEAYDRGHIAGGIDERLRGHDLHFAAINGQLVKVFEEMHALTLAVQRLGDQAVSRDATVVTTAAALKEAEAARRAKTEQSWTPVSKVFAALGALAALASVIGYLALVRK
jgi:hypothetical protein